MHSDWRALLALLHTDIHFLSGALLFPLLSSPGRLEESKAGDFKAASGAPPQGRLPVYIF